MRNVRPGLRLRREPAVPRPEPPPERVSGPATAWVIVETVWQDDAHFEEGSLLKYGRGPGALLFYNKNEATLYCEKLCQEWRDVYPTPDSFGICLSKLFTVWPRTPGGALLLREQITWEMAYEEGFPEPFHVVELTAYEPDTDDFEYIAPGENT